MVMDRSLLVMTSLCGDNNSVVVMTKVMLLMIIMFTVEASHESQESSPSLTYATSHHHQRSLKSQLNNNNHKNSPWKPQKPFTDAIFPLTSKCIIHVIHQKHPSVHPDPYKPSLNRHYHQLCTPRKTTTPTHTLAPYTWTPA